MLVPFGHASAHFVASVRRYGAQRLLLAAASAARPETPPAVPQVQPAFIAPGHSQTLSGFFFCKCARKGSTCLQAKSLRNLL